MYPISIAAVVVRLVLHRLLNRRELQTGEVLSLGLFEGGVLYYALQENTAVGAGCFIGFGSRIVLEHLKKRDIHKFALSLLGLALGLLITNVLVQLWEEVSGWIYDETWVVTEEEKVHKVRHKPKHQHRKRQSRNHIEGAPDPDTAAQQVSRRTNFDIPDAPVLSQWENLQKPLNGVGLEREVTELRQRASAAVGQTRKLQEERKWAYSQGNPARAFQLGWDIKRFQALSESLNREAAEKLSLARKHSLDSNTGEIGLRGLTSSEAIQLADKRISEAKASGDTHVRISLTGGHTDKFSYTEGNTTTDVVTTESHETFYHQVRPAVESHLRGRRHSVIQDPNSNDVLIVSVETLPPSPRGGSVFSLPKDSPRLIE